MALGAGPFDESVLDAQPKATGNRPVELEMRFIGLSLSAADAPRLQQMSDAVLRMPLIGAMMIDPIDFHVEGTEVTTEIALHPAEHQWLLAQMKDGCW